MPGHVCGLNPDPTPVRHQIAIVDAFPGEANSTSWPLTSSTAVYPIVSSSLAAREGLKSWMSGMSMVSLGSFNQISRFLERATALSPLARIRADGPPNPRENHRSRFEFPHQLICPGNSHADLVATAKMTE